MKSSKNYFKDINLIRLILCISILLYHLGLLEGGYLAVCCFFVLSAYFSCVCAFKNEKFSFVTYYLNKLKKIYFPLLIVIFITIGVVSFFPNISWFNLKPEVNSVIFGYNNFWQISANLDYFSKQMNSPFVHLWYISVLLQFDLVFPFIFIFLRKVGDKINKIIPCLITLVLAIISALFFYKMNYNQNIKSTYYGTFTRMFSLLFGLSLGFIHSYYKPIVFRKFHVNRILFYLYLIFLISLFILVDINLFLYPIAMILVTLISLRLISYGVSNNNKNSVIENIMEYLSSLSYFIYLVQYPVMFLFQSISFDSSLKVLLIIILTLLISIVLNFCINFKSKNIIIRIIKYIMLVCVLGFSIYGMTIYFKTKDYTKEMLELKNKLNENKLILEKKQEEYRMQFKQNEEDWNLKLEDLNNPKEEVEKIVNNLRVVGVGDSIMLGVIDNLYKTFPNGYFDAAISRSIWAGSGILQNLKSSQLMGDAVIINLGTNGDCPESCKVKIMNECDGKDVFWVNVKNDENVHVNSKLVDLSKKYSNLHIIDWKTASESHPEYFVSDGIHLTTKGGKAYIKLLYDTIYDVYLEKFNLEKMRIIKEHEEEMKSKISFYGNDIILNAFPYMQSNYSDANFVVNKSINYEMLKKSIEDGISNNTLTGRIVFSFDDKINLNESEYKSLIELCGKREIYILTTKKKTNNKLNNLSYENVKIIDFYQEIVNHKDYLMANGIHFSNQGNEALVEILNNYLNS